MNLTDIQKEGEELISILPETTSVMEELIEIANTKETFKIELFKKSFDAYSSSDSVRNARYIEQIIDVKNKYCNEFINSLRKIRFRKSIIELAKVTKSFKYYDFQIFRNEYFNLNDKIDEYTESQNNIKEFNKIEEVYNSVTKVTHLYDKMITNISKINELSELLSPGINECEFKIRFMNENRSLESLKQNIILIQNIYNNVNKIVGSEEELTYCKAESGTFALWLGGCIATLTAMKPLLEFAYKVYSEQLSPKAKLDLELKKQEVVSSKIKVRGEYLKLLKQASDDEEISKLNTIDKNELLTLLGDLDTDIKELYAKNPYIKLNNTDLGLTNMADANIPIELLEAACDEENLTLSDLQDNEVESN